MRLAQVPSIKTDILAKVNEYYAGQRRVFPCHTNRASFIGNQCERYIYYKRTAWEQESLPSVELQQIFEGGTFIEDLAIKKLTRAGYQVQSQQRDFHDKKYNLSGHIDGLLHDPATGEKFPLEIKGISSWEWEKLDCIEDFFNSAKHYVRAYPAQLETYLFFMELPVGVFYLVNKATYQGKPIYLPLDYDYMEELLKKCERINKAVASETPPERNLDPDTCDGCSFRMICLPDIKREQNVLCMDDNKLEEFIDRHQELKPLVKEYEAIDKNLKEVSEGKENIALSRWLITGKWITKKIDAKPAEERKEWRKKIISLAAPAPQGDL